MTNVIIVWMNFDSKLQTDTHRQAVATLKIYNSDVDRPGTTIFYLSRTI